MSDLNFSKWNLNERKKIRRVNANELANIIIQEQENLGLWSRQYGDTSDPERYAKGEKLSNLDNYPESPEDQSDLQYFYDQDYLDDADNAAEDLFVAGMTQEDFANEPGVTIVDDAEDAGVSFEEYTLGESEEDLLVPQKDDKSLDGLEGPFNFNGRELYYDPREEGGQYYDRGTDMYLDNDEASRVIIGEEDEDIIDFSSFSLGEADELDIDISDQSSAGSFYTGEEDADQDLTGGMGEMDEQGILRRMFAQDSRELPKAAGKKTDLPMKFMAWADSYKRGNIDPRTKTMLARKVIDAIGIDNDKAAMENLAHWIHYAPDAMEGIFKRLKADAEGQMSEEDNKSLPEPFWSYGFPQVKLRDMAEALTDSMIPGGDKKDTLEIIDFMRRELDALESKITTEK